jgi:hypothetical protein
MSVEKRFYQIIHKSSKPYEAQDIDLIAIY